jgi:photosystem II stability/assembly factor-like uncharacterized protein
MSFHRAFTILLLVFIAHGSFLIGSAAWTKQRTSSLAWLHAVFFLDQNRGWSAGSRGTLLSTRDGGKSWHVEPQPTEDTIRDIYFSDEQNGWLLCERNTYELKSNDEPRAYLLKSTDGGEHWKRVNFHGANVDARLVRAVFNDTGRGWTFGEGGALFTTRDAGSTWIKLQAPTHYLLLGGTFIDANNGWLVGAGSTILQTSDGGETWHPGRLSQTTSVRFNAISFINANQGCAVGSQGTIYRTMNGGRSWLAQNSGVTSDLFDVKFVGVNEGWVVGSDGTLLHTQDGGLHWFSERSGTAHALERLFFTDRSHGWAVGFGGTILALNDNRAVGPPRLR